MDNSLIQRKCIACNILKSRTDLIKITVNNKGEFAVLPDSKFVGRSAYICKSKDCIEKAFKKDKLFRILKIRHDDGLMEKIRAVLES